MKNSFLQFVLVILLAITGIGTVQSQINLQEGLVAWYPFNGDANDHSGSNLNGSIYGPLLTSDRFGNTNCAYQYDGVDDFIEIPSNLVNMGITQNFTLTFWANTGPTGWLTTLEDGTHETLDGIYFGFKPAENKLYAKIHTSNGGYFNDQIVVPGFTGNWTFICFQYTGSQMKIWFNEQLIYTHNVSGNLYNGNRNLRIGYPSGENFYNGEFDDFRIYNRILNDSEITELYNECNIVLNLPDSLLTCNQESITLDASAGFTSYLWNTGATTQTLAVNQTGTYTVTVENESGCSTTDSTYVNIINVQIAQNDTTICVGQSLDLSLKGGSAILTEGLVAWYPFNGNANDESGNGNDGLMMNGISLITDRFGNPNCAFDFDGVDDYIEVLSSPDLNFNENECVTMNAWIKMDEFPPINQRGILSKKYPEGNPPSNGWQFSVKNSGKLVSEFGPSYTSDFYSNQLLSLDNWYFVSFVVDRSTNTGYYYINGSLDNVENSSNYDIDVTNNYPMRIGISRVVAYPYFFNGIIDDVSIYDRVLTSDEIQELFNNQTNIYNVAWSTGQITPSITVFPEHSIIYYAVISDGINTCIDSIMININEISLNLPDTILACHQESILLDAGSGLTSYLWSTGATTQTLAVTETGTYTVTVEDEFGCTAIDSTYVNIIKVYIAQNDTTIFAGQSINLSLIGGTTNITDGLMAWYPFNGTANDGSGNNIDGVVNGATLTADRFGNLNSAYSFDGINDNITFNATPISIIDNYSISLWINPNNLNQASSAILIGNDDGANANTANGYGIGISDGSASYSSGSNISCMFDGTGIVYNSGYSLPFANQWYHVVLVRNNGISSIYINTIQTPNSSASVPKIPSDFFIGSQTGVRYFNGKIDDVRIYNRVLNSDELQTLYLSEFGNYSCVWSTSETTPFITVSPTETTTYYVEITDGINSCIDSVTVTVIPMVNLDLKAFLQGPYLYYNMTPFLNIFGYLPLEQPYNIPPWNYEGTEAIGSIPNLDIIDWVLVELRQSSGDVSTATDQTVIARQAGLLLRNGKIVDLDGSSPLLFHVNVMDNLYAVVMHRNHLPVISANPITEIDGIYVYDFTNNIDNVYGGVNACSGLGNGLWGLSSGNGNADDQIDNKDKNDVWLLQLESTGYKNGDYNMDGQVDNSDKIVKWEPNTGKGRYIP